MFCFLYLQYMYCEALKNNNLTKHSSNLQQHFKLQTALVSLYEHKIQKIQSCYGDDSISLSQKEQQIQISFRCMHVFLSRGFVWIHKSICFYQTSKIPSCVSLESDAEQRSRENKPFGRCIHLLGIEFFPNKLLHEQAFRFYSTHH